MTPEIKAFEYAIGVFAVLIGLAIADIATSFQRLLGSESTVKWDSLTLLAAAYSLCMAIYMWFDLWGVRNFAATRNFFFYILLFAELFVLYLIAASSLPPEGYGSDLREILFEESAKVLVSRRPFPNRLCCCRRLFYCGLNRQIAARIRGLCLGANVRPSRRGGGSVFE